MKINSVHKIYFKHCGFLKFFVRNNINYTHECAMNKFDFKN